jgi:hypothetical protein
VKRSGPFAAGGVEVGVVAAGFGGGVDRWPSTTAAVEVMTIERSNAEAVTPVVATLKSKT